MSVVHEKKKKKKKSRQPLALDEKDLKLELTAVVEIACRVEPDRSSLDVTKNLIRMRQRAWTAQPPGPNPYEAQIQRYLALPLEERKRRQRAAEAEAARRAAATRAAEEAEAGRWAALAAQQATEKRRLEELYDAWLENIRAGKVLHLTAADLDFADDPIRLRYLQLEREYGARLTRIITRCKTPFHKPPTAKAAEQWTLVRLFGPREAGRLLGRAEQTVQEARNRVDHLISVTPGARDEIERVLDEATGWRKHYGPPGDVTSVGDPADVKQIYRQDGRREIVSTGRSVRLVTYGGPDAEAHLDLADQAADYDSLTS